ncbi:MAG TPA: SDR family NAD(P)-dependent oxidoreductase, partial [Burkholderiaceae bacterium]|nr:SDR family NAD(P)-dependent oxidoreductase [Burkholderiaceae bacterium]
MKAQENSPAGVPALFDLRGQAVLVTGAASGLGLAMAEAMLDAGANLLMSDIDGDMLSAQVERLRSRARGALHAQVADVADTAQVEALVDAVLQRHGALDVAFANAGVSAGRGFVAEQGRLQNIDDAAWERVLR